MNIDSIIAETVTPIWRRAYNLGVIARKEGLPRECNLKDKDFGHGEYVLKVYKSAWSLGLCILKFLYET